MRNILLTTILSMSMLAVTGTVWSETINYSFGKYVGEVKNGVPHGYGILTYYSKSEFIEDDDKYTGNWKDGLRHGQGTDIKYFIHSIREYTGSWINDLPHGTGIQTTSDGRVFKGFWEKGVLKKGRYTYVTKNNPFDLGVYVGEFNKDKHFHGEGILTHANGTVQEGIWRNNVFKGKKKYKYLIDCMEYDDTNTIISYWHVCK
tara:strand:- start:141 stop:749 length:609 start_codon:yes stop_codon:yes gene_type:complete